MPPPRLTHCRQGHLFSGHRNGRNVCKVCRKAWSDAKRSRRRVPGLVPINAASYALKLAWITRREIYGERGISSASRQHMIMKLKAIPGRRKTHCKRGHEFRPDTVWVNRQGRRTCKVCRRLSGRPEWATTGDGVRVNVRVKDQWYLTRVKVLKDTAVSLHPDKGHRSSRPFIKAMRALDDFRQQQHKEYTTIGLDPPKRKR